MSATSDIEWTDATWNPVTGCTKISAGCDFCYAEAFSERFRGVARHHFEMGFDVTLRPERLKQPSSWSKPKFIFVNSMSDLFHKAIPREFVDRIFDEMEKCDWHVFQVLTKRSSIMRDYVNQRYSEGSAPRHIWLGTTVENAQAKSRILHLRNTHAAVRFISFEPLLESLGPLDLQDIHWAIVGGESGNRARPMDPNWPIQILESCRKFGTLFFFKQWGRFGSDGLSRNKKLNGRLLGGIEYNERPSLG